MAAIEATKFDAGVKAECSLFELPGAALFSILDADQVKVNDEKTVLAFVF